MAISSYASNPLNKEVNTFGDWFTRTNQIGNELGTRIVTVDTNAAGGTTTGNATIVGIFSANVIAVEGELRGGTVGNTQPLTISSDLNLTGSDIVANTLNFTIGGNNFIISVNTTSVSGDVITFNNDEINFNGNVEFTGEVTFTTDTLIVPTGNTADRPGTPSDGMLRFNTEIEEFEGYNGTKWGLIGGSLNATVATSNTDLILGRYVYADTTGGPFTVTLPLAPAAGNAVKLSGNGWSNNNLTVARNGQTIEDFADDLLLDIEDVFVELVYDGSTWQVFVNIASNFSDTIVTISDTNANTTQYITFTDSSNGVLTDINISSDDLTFDPSSGTLSTTELNVTTITSEDITANTVTANDFNSLSDASAKTNILPISSALDVLDKINPVEFNWINGGKKSYGVLAQELEKILPELVTQNKDTKYVNYIPLIALLLEGYKDMAKKIQILENK